MEEIVELWYEPWVVLSSQGHFHNLERGLRDCYISSAELGFRKFMTQKRCYTKLFVFSHFEPTMATRHLDTFSSLPSYTDISKKNTKHWQMTKYNSLKLKTNNNKSNTL